jgi:hypothetical protein
MKKNFSNRFLLISCFVVFLILSLLLTQLSQDLEKQISLAITG